MKSGVYCILNLINGKHYIGSSLEISRRLSRHKQQLNANKHGNIKLQRAWIKYGTENFRFNLIETCGDDELLIREQFWIDQTMPFYNIYRTAGSSFGYKHSDETKAKFRLAQSRRDPETNRKISAKNLGKVRSEESLVKYREMHLKLSDEEKLASVNRMIVARVGVEISNSGKAKISESNSRNFEVTNSNGESFVINNLTKFCLKNGLDRSCMFRVSTGKYKQHKGWVCVNPRYEF